MRPLRLAVLATTAAVILGSAFATAGNAGASTAAAPSAPYNVFSINGPVGAAFSSLPPNLPPVTDSSTATFDADTDAVHAGANTIRVADIEGGVLHTGHYAVGSAIGDVSISIDAGLLNCYQAASGSVDISEIAVDGSDVITKLALAYSVQCPNLATYSGILRFNSAVAYAVADVSPLPIDFGTVYQQATSSPQVLTVTGRGPTRTTSRGQPPCRERTRTRSSSPTTPATAPRWRTARRAR